MSSLAPRQMKDFLHTHDTSKTNPLPELLRLILSCRTVVLYSKSCRISFSNLHDESPAMAELL